jgi:hypothetical protein
MKQAQHTRVRLSSSGLLAHLSLSVGTVVSEEQEAATTSVWSIWSCEGRRFIQSARSYPSTFCTEVEGEGLSDSSGRACGRLRPTSRQ